MQTTVLSHRTQAYVRLLAVIALLLIAVVGAEPRLAAAAPSPLDLNFDGTDDPNILNGVNGFLKTTLPGTNAPNGSATVNTVAGALQIATSGGDLLPGGTTQDNALGVSYDSSGSYTIGARLLHPLLNKPYQSAGIYIGKSSTQYIRFSVGAGSKSSSGERLQLDVMESNGKLRSSTIPLPQGTLAGANTFDLFLNIEHGGSGRITALYRVNSDDPQQGRLAAARNFPRWLRGNAGTVFAGVVSTNRGTFAPITVSFDWFRLTTAPQVTATVTGAKSVDKDGVSPGQSVSPGDTLTYTISVTNNSGTAATVTLQDPIPADTSFKGSLTTNPGNLPAATFDSATNRVNWSGSLGAGQSVIFSFQVTINPAPLRSSTIVNTASVSSGGSGLPSLLSTSTVVGLTPDLSDSTYIAAPATVGPNGTVTYTLNLLNDGTAAANGATVQLFVPPGTTLVANSATKSSGNLSVDPSLTTMTWTAAGPLDVDGVVTISFAVQIGSSFANGEAIVSRAIMQANDVLPTIATAQAIYSVATTVGGTKTVDKAEADPGAPLTYTITVTNNSAGAATDIQVVDPMPQDTGYQSNLSASPGAPAPTYDTGSNQVVWQIPSLAASQSITMSFQVQISTQPLHSAVIVNKATLTTGAGASPTLLSASTVVRGVADLSDSLYTADPATVGPNGTITYALNLLNDGTAAATNATAELSIPAGATLVANSAAATSGALTVNTALNKITWTAGSPLPIGGVVRISFQVRLPSAVTSSVFVSTATMQADGTAPNVETAQSIFSQSAPSQTHVYLPVIAR